jgi:hypothetical protein
MVLFGKIEANYAGKNLLTDLDNFRLALHIKTITKKSDRQVNGVQLDF